MGRPKKLVPDLYWLASEGQYAANTGPDRARRRYGPDRQAAEAAYRQDVARLLAGTPHEAPREAAPARLVGDLIRHYLTARKGLVSDSQLAHFGTVCTHLAELYGHLPASEFGAPQMRGLKERLLTLDDSRAPEGKCVALVRAMLLEKNPRPSAEVNAKAREAGHADSVIQAARARLGARAKKAGDVWMLEAPAENLASPRPRKLSRGYVNKLLGIVRTMWRRLASDGLVTVAMRDSVCSVLNAEAGQGRETSPRLPAPDADVVRTLPHMGAALRAMVQVQRLTGMRPGEVCRLKRGELSTHPGEVVHLRVGEHLVPVAAQTVGDVTVWLYVPSAHKGSRRKKPRAVPVGPQAQVVLAAILEGKGPKDNLFTGEGGRPYTPMAYATAVRRAARRGGVPEFTPYQLRHSAATGLAQEEEATDVQAVLGHSSVAMTMHYVADLVRRAAGVAARQG